MNKWFDKFQALKNINLEVNQQEKIVICGPSGSGKSTLIRCINRLEEHQDGQIIVDGNLKSAEKLVTSHLRLVAKIAMGYKGYGLPVNEMISEGNVGLMQAVKKFEPEKGFTII